VQAADMTDWLAIGYVASYNVPIFPEVRIYPKRFPCCWWHTVESYSQQSQSVDT
jgi:hypothetical protein